jgi:hypothetical protein
VVLGDGSERAIRTADPSGALASLVNAGTSLRSVDIHRPSLDDLYHALEDRRVAV